MRKVVVLSLAVAISACGGGSSDNVGEISGDTGEEEGKPSEAYDALRAKVLNEQGEIDSIMEPGIYSIELSDAGGTEPADQGTALIGSSGRIVAFYDDFLTYQHVTNNAGSWSGQFETTNSRNTLSPFTLEADPALSHEGANAEVSFEIAATGDLPAREARIFQGPENNPVKIADMAGDYADERTGITTDLTITEEGVITGSDSANCKYYGEILVTPEDSQTVEGVIEKSGCTTVSDRDFPGEAKNGAYIFQGFYNESQGRFMMFPQQRKDPIGLVFQVFGGQKSGEPEQDLDEDFASSFVTGDSTLVGSVKDYMSPGLFQNQSYIRDDAGTTITGEGFGILSSTGRMAFANSEFSGYARIEVDESGTYTEPTLIAGALVNGWSAIDESPRIIRGFPSEASIVDGDDVETGTLEYRMTIDNKDLDQGDSWTQSDRDITYYSTAGSPPTREFTIDGDHITGVDDGCLFSGTVVQPDTEIPVFEATMEASSCAPNEAGTAEDRSGTYKALVHFSESGDVQDSSDIRENPIMRMIYANDIVVASFKGTIDGN